MFRIFYENRRDKKVLYENRDRKKILYKNRGDRGKKGLLRPYSLVERKCFPELKRPCHLKLLLHCVLPYGMECHEEGLYIQYINCKCGYISKILESFMNIDIYMLKNTYFCPYVCQILLNLITTIHLSILQMESHRS